LAHFDVVPAGAAPRFVARLLSRLSGSACLVCAALSGCTELAPGSDTLVQSTEPILPDAGPSSDPRWVCLDDLATSGAVSLRPSVELTLSVTDIGTDQPPAGLTARACNKLDVNCTAPVASAPGVAADGALHLTVPQLFNGFVEITSPTSVPTLYFLNRDLQANASEALSVVNPMSLGALATSGGVSLDPTLGHLLIRVFDCDGEPASGVELTNNVGGQPFIFVDGLPSLGPNVTTRDGLGGYVNVPLGFATLRGRTVSGSRQVAESSVVVRERWFTYGDVEPVPQ
jgi:hypothetical protein